MRRFLLVAVMCGAASVAQAADMPDLPFLRGSFTDGLTSAKVNWQGYYVGGQVSYGSVTSKVPPGANTDLQSSFRPPTGVNYNWRPLPNAHSNTTGFGAFAGYNSQWEDVVLSLEANYIHDGIRSVSDSMGVIYNTDLSFHSLTHSNAVVKLSDFGSLRVRAGYVMGCFLPYAFAGTGFGSQTVDRTISAFPYPVLGTSAASKTKLVYGYSAGVGIDVMLVGGLFMRTEYEYRRVTSDIETNINTVRAGLGYKF
ncbi:outer membrane beta-barrel protein [Bradyrhizobium sp. 170]|uniref:outer membrane protein n=1 Tax=Bradyrhizobium sp. 170 TaxID=2782641 RepID=UPI001FFFF02D|nr:outer membrane beta-barrel protein [Bradyrhizobium sp. 170]UPK02906.1 porin family protein [Bradyrhizobium sp. 170]